MKRCLIAVLILCACHRTPVPTNTLLWRVNGAWTEHPRGDGTSVRTAQATFISFRASHEYVEHHCTVIEQPDTSVYIVSGAKHVIAIGRWEQHGADVKVRRQMVSPQNAGVLCDHAQLRFRISGASVIGDTGELTDGIYAPVTRLVSPDFESYINAAKSSPVNCPEK
ncbi:MAG TPA: hypothetical protein VGS96_00390 [Thermoanaerobaculia bacterium]|nr:hypothetical protein [Thermoanaerobaculia bacterium]